MNIYLNIARTHISRIQLSHGIAFRINPIKPATNTHLYTHTQTNKPPHPQPSLPYHTLTHTQSPLPSLTPLISYHLSPLSKNPQHQHSSPQCYSVPEHHRHNSPTTSPPPHLNKNHTIALRSLDRRPSAPMDDRRSAAERFGTATYIRDRHPAVV